MKTFRVKLTEKLVATGVPEGDVPGILESWNKDPVSKGLDLDDFLDDHEPVMLLLAWTSIQRFIPKCGPLCG